MPRIAIILLERVERALIVAHPHHMAEMTAIIAIQSTAYHGIDFTRRICQVEKTAAKLVIHELPTHKIGFIHRLRRHRSILIFHQNVVGRQAIFHKRAAGLILLIIAIAFGIVERHIECPLRREAVTAKKLEIMHRIIVILVGIERHITILVGILATGIIATAIFLHILFRRIVPRQISTLLTSVSQQAQRRSAGIIAHLTSVGIHIGCCPVDIAVRTDIRQSSFCRPMPAYQPGAHFYCFLVSIIHAIRPGK